MSRICRTLAGESGHRMTRPVHGRQRGQTSGDHSRVGKAKEGKVKHDVEGLGGHV